MSTELNLPDLWSRRRLLKRAGAGFGLLGLQSLLGGDGLLANSGDAINPLVLADSHFRAKAKSVIFVFAYGGPSHVDLLDPKPALHKWHGKPIPVFRKEDAFNTKTTQPTAMRSPFEFSQHGQSGLPISEMFPHISRHADDLCVIRSMHCESNNHAPALFQMNTGFTLAGRPSMGAWTTYGLGSENDSLPAFVVMWDYRGGPVGGAQNWTAGFIPAAYQGVPFRSQGEAIIDLNRPGDVSAEQQRARLDLIAKLNDRHLAANPGERELAARIYSYELAARMQLAAPEAVDITQESATTRRLYGMEQPISAYFGRQCLMARRLVERGVRFVQLYSGGGDQMLSWDAHGNLRANLEQHCPEVDQPVAGLIQDLKQRGMLEETLIIWGGEFGRMPTNQGSAGRDHNPRGFSMFLAGGGIKGGMSYGSTDEFGYAAAENPVSIPDLHATCLHQLGLDHTRLTYHHRGRDMRLTDVSGRVLHEIIG
ncbi:MAG: hypothetical protein CMO80_13345 [Verrucomicrobiales bacterium]|nr:hypothetical protein [Verrucomicrobiales bacterium]